MGHRRHGTSGFGSLLLGSAAIAALLGSASLFAAGGKGGPLKKDDLEPINTFLGGDAVLDGGGTGGPAAPPPIQAAPRTGSGTIPGAGTSFPTSGTVTNSPTQTTPGYSSDKDNSYSSTPTAAPGAKPNDYSTVTPEITADTQSPTGSNLPAPTSTVSSTELFNSSGSSGSTGTSAATTGQNAEVGGSFSATGKGVFGSKGLFRGSSPGQSLSPEFASDNPDDLENKSVEELDKYITKGGKLPEQFLHGSKFATAAGAGPMAPQKGASIKVGGNIYEFRAGAYVKIAAPKPLAERKPAGVARLPATIDLHANLGPLPVDRYEARNESTLAVCKKDQTVRQCVKAILADKAKQKVKGLRFLFGLTGGGSSTAILPDGKLNPDWLKNMTSFMNDVKEAGIKQIAPTPVFGGWAGDRVKETEVTDECLPANHLKRKVRLRFFAAQPWGSRLEDNSPHGAGVTEAYNCSPANPIFVGWKAIHGALEAMLAAAKTAKLEVYEFDLQHETNVDWFTVQARMIYDNKHASSGDPDLFKMARFLMSKNGFEASKVTYSVSDTTPSKPGYDCASSYGDSARVAALSALLDAIAGAPFGHAKDWNVEKGLGCGGSGGGKIRLAVKHTLPGIVDVHSYTTGEPQMIKVETTLWANAVDSAMKKRGLASALFVLGETHSNTRGPNGKSCEGASPDAGVDVARALGDSRLAVRRAVIRPWYNQASSCYSMTQRLNPPLIPNR